MGLLNIENLNVTFDVHGEELRAVDGVSLQVEKGEVLGLVGESGCGKTTLGNAVIGLVPVSGGKIEFDGKLKSELSRGDMKEFRSDVQMIFQDPFASLNPRITAGGCLAEVLRVHGLAKGKEAIDVKVKELLELVGLDPEYAVRYPHEFSGGQRQRIGIARALAVEPILIIADEAVSALDVSVQVQILNLLRELQNKMDLSYLFIAHDLAVVRYMCDRVMVMYLGKIVESAKSDELFSNASHPYTKALLSAVPDVDKGLRSREEGGNRIVLQGDVPSATERISGCPFHTRCQQVQDICKTQVPPEKAVKEGHTSVCHFS